MKFVCIILSGSTEEQTATEVIQSMAKMVYSSILQLQIMQLPSEIKVLKVYTLKCYTACKIHELPLLQTAQTLFTLS